MLGIAGMFIGKTWKLKLLKAQKGHIIPEPIPTD